MSSFNNMDKVPVKISENYKPPPRVYQLPQATVNKLQLPQNYYNEGPQYYYDFQLERKVLAKMPEWRRMRQLEREARRERKEKREQERLHLMEAQHKQMLGAVSYPSTEDLSSSESDSEEIEQKLNTSLNTDKQGIGKVLKPKKAVMPAQTGDFYNILQPTILSSNTASKQCALNSLNTENCAQTLVCKVAGVIKEGNTFNYKDFEEDTSSPFDNIELKTINDLDILAQVLHNTQINARAKQLDEDRAVSQKRENSNREILETKENTHIIVDESKAENVDNSNTTAASLNVIENTNAALQRVDFENLSHGAWQNQSIPNNASKRIVSEESSNNYNYNKSTLYVSNFNNSTTHQQQQTYIPYNHILNDVVEQKQHPPLYQRQQFLNLNSLTLGNRNYWYPPNCNGVTSDYNSHNHVQATSYVGSNANNYLSPLSITNESLQQHVTNESSESDIKSKSVPDILKELSDEVRSSELRRSRYYSYNSDEGKPSEQEQVDDDRTPTQSPIKCASKHNETCHYDQLAAPVQRLAKDISSMGFPLERVAKIVQIFGADDKKIIEHLIPLSELMDLGFDETKISEALVKFNNNKEKALEYLIS